jgi:hypothetical protein
MDSVYGASERLCARGYPVIAPPWGSRSTEASPALVFRTPTADSVPGARLPTVMSGNPIGASAFPGSGPCSGSLPGVVGFWSDTTTRSVSLRLSTPCAARPYPCRTCWNPSVACRRSGRAPGRSRGACRGPPLRDMSCRRGGSRARNRCRDRVDRDQRVGRQRGHGELVRRHLTAMADGQPQLVATGERRPERRRHARGREEP